MEALDARVRWLDQKHLAAAMPVLTAVFVSKKFHGQADLRAITVALDGGPSLLHQANFQDSDLDGLDASEAKMSCSFSRATINRSIFDRALFDTCRFKASRFSACTFVGSKIDSPTLDDAFFLSCSFQGARITGRGTHEYGGRRMVFDGCNFDGTVFQNLQIRACTFRNCSFSGAMFKRCLLTGVKFEGGEPDPANLVACT